MPKLADNTVLVMPGSATLVYLSAGDDLPEWADGMVGDHLLVEAEKPKRAPARASKAVDKSDD